MSRALSPSPIITHHHPPSSSPYKRPADKNACRFEMRNRAKINILIPVCQNGCEGFSPFDSSAYPPSASRVSPNSQLSQPVTEKRLCVRVMIIVWASAVGRFSDSVRREAMTQNINRIGSSCDISQSFYVHVSLAYVYVQMNDSNIWATWATTTAEAYLQMSYIVSTACAAQTDFMHTSICIGWLCVCTVEYNQNAQNATSRV